MKTIILVVSLLANVFLGVLLLLPAGEPSAYVECLERRLELFIEGDTVEANSFSCGHEGGGAPSPLD